MAVRKLLAVFALLAVSATSALAAPGDCRLIRGADTPDDPSDDVSVCRQDVWIHQADTKAGNAAALGHGAYPSWNTTPPGASVQTGAGGGYANAAAFSQNTSRTDSRGTATFRGTFTGNLDNIAASLYLFNPGRQASADQAVWIQLKIDDEIIYQSGAADRTPLVTAGNAVFKTDFAFVNLYNAMETFKMETGADKTHTLELQISGWFSVNDNSIYVYDTTEVPAGMVFNLEPASLKAFTKQIDVNV